MKRARKNVLNPEWIRRREECVTFWLCTQKTLPIEIRHLICHEYVMRDAPEKYVSLETTSLLKRMILEPYRRRRREENNDICDMLIYLLVQLTGMMLAGYVATYFGS